MTGAGLPRKRTAPTFHNTVKTLSRFTIILKEAAEYFVRGNTRLAQAGRNKVERDVYGGTGRESFHADVQLLLATLLEQLASHGDTLNPSLQREVSDTLGVYDALISESYPWRDSATIQQGVGLWNLQVRYERRWEDPSGHLRLGYRRCLSCPTAPLRKALKNRIRQCIVAFQLYKPEAAAADELGIILLELDRIEEREAPSSLSMHIESLQRVLETHWKCCCHSRALHESQKVRLSFSAARDEDVLGIYRMCIVPAAGAPRTATLYLTEPAQEPVQKPARRRVQFNLASGQDAWSWQVCRSFCATAHPAGVHTTFKASETSLEYRMTNDQSNYQMASETSWMSLHHLLSTEPPSFNDVYTFAQRVRLGLTLAYFYLYTSHTSIWGEHEAEPSVWFGDHPQSSRSSELQPYIQYGPHIGNSSTTSSLAKFMNTERPSLPALGKLLLEIWVGSKMLWDDLLTHIDSCKRAPGGRYWALAVETCLYGAGDDILKRSGNLRDSAVMRAYFVLRVIKSMQWLLVYCCGEPLGDIFDATIDNIKHADVIPVVHDSEMMLDVPGTPSGNGNIADIVDTNQLCLHDDADEWKTSNGREYANLTMHQHRQNILLTFGHRHRAATEWQGKLQAKTRTVFDSIMSPPNPAVPVKVAIIDTGVSFGKRASMLYSRRVKEFRSWVGVAEENCACGEEMPLDNGDTDGHGTHTASVIMATDLHCDVYIAKAFTGRPGKSGSCVADTHRSVANVSSLLTETNLGHH
jgi:hypothetical protein